MTLKLSKRLRRKGRSVLDWPAELLVPDARPQLLAPIGFMSGPSEADIGDPVNYSVRFNSADSANLSRTFVTPTSNTVWSLSLWIKKTKLSTLQSILSAGTAGIYWNTSDQFTYYSGGVPIASSVPVFRDVAKFAHVFVVSNGTTVKLHFNNVEWLSFTGTIPTLNSAVAHRFGSYSSGATDFIDAYMTDVCFVDGTALTPSSFGRISADTGAWVHKNPSGLTYGTNGFRLQFNTGAVASDLGTDTSGNGNTFTVTNLSVTAGAGNDWLADTPTNTYCTLAANNFSGAGPINGGLDYNATYVNVGTMGMPSGKWYWEALITNTSMEVGVVQTNFGWGTTNYLGISATWKGVAYRSLANGKYIDGSASAYGASYTTNDVIGMAFNGDASPQTIEFFKNNVSQGVLNCTTGFTYAPAVSSDGGGSGASFNFGQRAFTYTPPTGFLALCTANLPTPAIGATAATLANKHFDVATWTANVSNPTAGQKSIALGFQPDLIWSKARGAAESHYLADILRGFNSGSLWLKSNSTAAEGADAIGNSTAKYVPTSSGFDIIDTDYNSGEVYFNGRDYVGWNWKANGAGVSNTAGSITSTVSANTLAGFSIVTYTGTSTGNGDNKTVGHGLSVAPKLVIVKNRGAVENWHAWHAGLTSGTYNLVLNSTAAQSNDATRFYQAPTSTVIGLGGNSSVSLTGNTYVAYCFAEVEGFSKIGSYIGNGSADGPFVWCGFRPRFVMIKEATPNAHMWLMIDTARNTYNVGGDYLAANSSSVENSPYAVAANTALDINSNGFKLRNPGSSSGENNGSGSTYIFYAIAEVPFKYSNAR